MYFNIYKSQLHRSAQIFLMNVFLVAAALQIRDIFKLWLELRQNKANPIVFHVKEFAQNNLQRALSDTEEKKLNLILLKFTHYWAKYSRMRVRFEHELSDWLDTEVFTEDVCVVSSCLYSVRFFKSI